MGTVAFACPETLVLSGAHSTLDADRELARRCIDDTAARAELYRRYADQVYRLACRIVGNRALAEDVVQDTFVEAFRCIGSYSGRGPLGGWIRRLAIRNACNRQRRMRSRPTELSLVDFDRGQSPEGKLGARSLLRVIERHLQQMPQKRRLVYLLHEVEGYRLSEVAALLDISLTAAKKRVWRARRMLHKALANDPELAELLPSLTEQEDR
ncbi:MAG: RNA polymerase sigma factor [Deltaproteobacteria bacterium]|nr:RNA polymerase sigma factor [Deltaproteobacteria bacterium]